MPCTLAAGIDKQPQVGRHFEGRRSVFSYSWGFCGSIVVFVQVRYWHVISWVVVGDERVLQSCYKMSEP